MNYPRWKPSSAQGNVVAVVVGVGGGGDGYHLVQLLQMKTDAMYIKRKLILESKPKCLSVGLEAAISKDCVLKTKGI